MVSTLLKKSSILHPIESINNLIGAAGIKAKQILGDIGLADTKTFTTFGDYDKASQEDQKLARERLAELEKEGYGANHRKTNI